MAKLVLIFLLLNVILVSGELILLDDDSFEHLTQASTGATTGDWVVLMTPGDGKCEKCVTSETELEKVRQDENFRGSLNVAKMDIKASRITFRRFKVTKPTIMFFRLGHQWNYGGALTYESLKKFLKDGYSRQSSRPVMKQLDRFDVWQEDFVKEVKSAYKERRVPEKYVLLVFLGCGVVFLILISCFLPSNKGEGVQKEQKKKR